jgi:hypothetical protein
MSTRLKTLAVLATATGVAVCTGVGSAGATATNHGPGLHVVKTLSSAYVGPLQFAVSGRTVLVADAFTSTLNLLGRSTPIATGPSPASGGDLAGVGIDPHSHAVAYTTSNGDHSVTALTILQRGKKKIVADLSGFEKRRNPDGKLSYGATTTPNACAIKALTAAGIPITYTGTVDSHPYAVTAIGNGAWAVADAGGNDIVKVDSRGHVSLISVLPPATVKITTAFAAANGLPSCVSGFSYRFEAVPTDVEIGRHGVLYVTSLPGGPEGPGSGNPGSVYRIAAHGQPVRIATGFAGATNLAIDSHGAIFVAEISTGTVAKVVCGKPKPVLSLPGVVALEFANGHLFASTAPAATGGSGPGTIVELGYGAS